MQQFVKKKEIEWILKLRTAFPYGLKNEIGEEHQRNSDIPIGISFAPIKRNKEHPKDRGIRRLVKIIQLKTFLIYIKIN